MAALTVADLKLYLRIEHAAADALITRLLAQATAAVESFLHRPITAVSRTFVDTALPAPGGRIRALLVPITPVGALTSVTHQDGEVLTVADLAVDNITGMVTYANGSHFRCGPWTIVASVGLSNRSDFAAKIEPAINGIIEQAVADLYLSRNPAASQETEGGGVSRSYARGASGLPTRLEAMLRPWRLEEI